MRPARHHQNGRYECGFAPIRVDHHTQDKPEGDKRQRAKNENTLGALPFLPQRRQYNLQLWIKAWVRRPVNGHT